MSKTYDVVGIGNAIVDVISHGTDDFLDHMGITKGIMQLVEREGFGRKQSISRLPFVWRENLRMQTIL